MFFRRSLIAAAALAFVVPALGAAQAGGRDQADRTITAPERTQVIESLGKALKERYVFPEVGQRLDARLRERLAAKAYDTVSSAKAFSRILSEDLAAIAHDKHLNVFYSAEPIPSGPPQRPTGPDPFASLNYGFMKVERMAGNVGYLRLDAFADPQGDANRDVYVRTSSRTFSAAEEFTYNLKTQKRATIVGEATGGGANPGGMERLSDPFGAFVPSGRAINPITKTNWEGTGVTADIAVAADKALDAAYRDALTKLATKTRNPMIDRETKETLAKLPQGS